jgi:ABC-type dipeptide/oligopeptide/nickel transport system permease subunit
MDDMAYPLGTDMLGRDIARVWRTALGCRYWWGW